MSQACQPEEGSYLTANEFLVYNVTTREKDSVVFRVCRNY